MLRNVYTTANLTLVATLREARDCFLFTHDEDLIEYEKLFLLFDVNTSRNPEFPYILEVRTIRLGFDV